MIIREEQFHYIFITQHTHAYTAGEILGYLKKFFIDINQFETLKFALHQHDRGWIIPDAHPILNDAEKRPYDFLNYPEKFKLHFCKIGIDQVAQANLYAALLCSKYYCQFFEKTESEEVKEFIKKEVLRQNYLVNKLKIDDLDPLYYHLTLMRFCINISMFLCMNKVGSDKDREVPVFRNGFEGSEFFHKVGNTKIVAFYRNKKSSNVRFNSPVFEIDFNLKIPCKVISKALITKVGLVEAYLKTKTTIISVKLCKDSIPSF
jgi:hypothetical protein